MQQLARAQRGIHRRLRYVRLPKKATALVVAVAIAVRTAIGFGVVAAAAPVVMTTGPRAGMRWARTERARDLGRLGAQVDAAAKGAYIVGRDLDTVSRMVRRVQDEVEHEREVARLASRYRDPQLVREAARVVEGGAAGMEAQMEELEEHVCLCLITINRSRRMVEGGAEPAVANAMA